MSFTHCGILAGAAATGAGAGAGDDEQAITNRMAIIMLKDKKSFFIFQLLYNISVLIQRQHDCDAINKALVVYHLFGRSPSRYPLNMAGNFSLIDFSACWNAMAWAAS